MTTETDANADLERARAEYTAAQQIAHTLRLKGRHASPTALEAAFFDVANARRRYQALLGV